MELHVFFGDAYVLPKVSAIEECVMHAILHKVLPGMLQVIDSNGMVYDIPACAGKRMRAHELMRGPTRMCHLLEPSRSQLYVEIPHDYMRCSKKRGSSSITKEHRALHTSRCILWTPSPPALLDISVRRAP